MQKQIRQNAALTKSWGDDTIVTCNVHNSKEIKNGKAPSSDGIGPDSEFEADRYRNTGQNATMSLNAETSTPSILYYLHSCNLTRC